MYAIMYLPEALWIRDVRNNISPFSNDVVVFKSEVDSETYITETLLPYCQNSGIRVIREYLEIFSVELTDVTKTTTYGIL